MGICRSNSLKKFEVLGGVVSGTEESRGKISLDRPNRQWDYPYAWYVLLTVARKLKLIVDQATSSNHDVGWLGKIRIS